MTVRLSDEARQYIALFEEVTGVAARDCVVDRASRSDAERSSGEGNDPRDDRIVFVVPAGEMPDAIGPDGRHVSSVERQVGTDVELVEDADEPGPFVANALRPAAVYDVTVREQERDGDRRTVAYAEVDGDDVGAAIGAGGRNVEMATRLADRHFGVDAVELVQDPDACIAAVADETGVEPEDCCFDPVDERLLVVAPAGEVAATVGPGGEHVDALRSRLGWPVEVVEWAGDAAGLVANALAPATVHNVTVSEAGTTVAYAEVDRADTGVAIGRGGRRIRRARLLAARYYDVDDVQLP